jgi:phosphoribosylaminoimidazole-succinocarboxamide synthase
MSVLAEMQAQGKVRDIYEAGSDRLLMVTSDRISAFDVVLPNPITDKGRVLSGLSLFWFDQTGGIIPNHVISASVDDFPSDFADHREELAGRSMLVRRADMIPIECVARGYLSGSGWKEYRSGGAVCGIRLPGGLVESDRLPEPIFTPATKAASGHDENISYAELERLIGPERAAKVRDVSLRLYKEAADYAAQRGIIIADTKFEFGLDESGHLTLIDEALTPDSSRFWPMDTYRVGSSTPSFDKQFVRDYLETLTWNKQAPGPHLPAEIIERTAAKYAEALQRLTA